MQQRSPKGGVRFFFDRSVGKRVPRIIREFGFDVSIHDEIYHQSKRIPDLAWILPWTRRGRILFTCDLLRDLKRNEAKLRLYASSGARAFFLDGNATNFVKLKTMMCGWESMLRVCQEEEGPFMYMIGHDGRTTRKLKPPDA
jgi:hypothetical protein